MKCNTKIEKKNSEHMRREKLKNGSGKMTLMSYKHRGNNILRNYIHLLLKHCLQAMLNHKAAHHDCQNNIKGNI